MLIRCCVGVMKGLTCRVEIARGGVENNPSLLYVWQVGGMELMITAEH